MSPHYLHAVDYLTYAYLQGGQDKKAKAVVDAMRAVARPFAPHAVAAYTLAASPARLALERHDWEAAAALAPRQPAAYPWDTAPAFEAITHFARALGSARSKRLDQAAAEIATLARIHEVLVKKAPYWATQVEIQRLGARAWLEYARGKKARGLELMRDAAALEQATPKHPVTPGAVLPAGELLGDMLADAGKHADALAAYQAVLERAPNRFNSLYGAAVAAENSGDPARASSYYRQLVEICGEADGERPALERARRGAGN
jgi:tetratricopeptide (TPR) repeat protein